MMRTIFVVNPKAGKGRGWKGLVKRIEAAAVKVGEKIDIHITKGEGEAESFVRKYMEELEKEGSDFEEEIRFIACGGDGTLNEVLNGAILSPLFHRVALGIVPTGTGNDFARNFPQGGDFSDIEAQLKGKALHCDALLCTTVEGSGEKKRFCANMFNIGFDCNVAHMTDSLKKKPFLKGHLAYLAAAVVNLAGKRGADLRIEIDGDTVHKGPLLLTTVANGAYCGGGVKSNPLASVQDGKMDILVVKNLTRRGIIGMMSKYIKGIHLEEERMKETIKNYKGKTLRITPEGGRVMVCTDGEITEAGTMEFRVEEKAFRAIVPAK